METVNTRTAKRDARLVALQKEMLRGKTPKEQEMLFVLGNVLLDAVSVAVSLMEQLPSLTLLSEVFLTIGKGFHIQAGGEGV